MKTELLENQYINILKEFLKHSVFKGVFEAPCILKTQMETFEALCVLKYQKEFF